MLTPSLASKSFKGFTTTDGFSGLRFQPSDASPTAFKISIRRLPSSSPITLGGDQGRVESLLEKKTDTCRIQSGISEGASKIYQSSPQCARSSFGPYTCSTHNVKAMNEIYIKEEDYDRLRESIDMHDSFDQIGLVQKIEKHKLLEMRQIAAYIYKKVERWKQSIALSKKDNLYKDAMESCPQSDDGGLFEELLIYFIKQVGDSGIFRAWVTASTATSPE